MVIFWFRLTTGDVTYVGLATVAGAGGLATVVLVVVVVVVPPPGVVVVLIVVVVVVPPAAGSVALLPALGSALWPFVAGSVLSP